MTIQVGVAHLNKGYEKKLRVTTQNKHHETGEWTNVSTAIVSDGQLSIMHYVHGHSRLLVEEVEKE